MQMTVTHEGLPLKIQNILTLDRRRGSSQAFLTAASCNCFSAMRFNHLTDTHLRLCDRKNSLGARGFGLNFVHKIHIRSEYSQW